MTVEFSYTQSHCLPDGDPYVELFNMTGQLVPEDQWHSLPPGEYSRVY